MPFYNPDGHIIEIGETMKAVVWRFFEQGFSVDSIGEKSSMPREFIKGVLEEYGHAPSANASSAEHSMGSRL